MTKKSKNIYLLKGDTKKIRKAIALITRTHGTFWVQVHPLNDKQYFAFMLDEKLVRRIKLSKLNNRIRTKKLISLYTLISNCRRFDTIEEFESFKEKNKNTKSYWKSSNYTQMPKSSKKDNQKIYGKSDWEGMSKTELIKAANKVHGVKIRKPRKTANKRTWRNFLEKFGNKNA